MSYNKDDCHVDDVVEEDEQGEPINPIIRPLILEIEDANGSAHMISFCWVLSHRKLGLSTELEL